MSEVLGQKQIYPLWLVYDAALLIADKMEGCSSGEKRLYLINSTRKEEEDGS